MTDVISLEHVSKRLGQRDVLKDVSLNIQQGDIFGYLGPNGAGKTTTIRIILGLMQATSGKASVLGQDSQLDSVRQRIGFVLEADGLYDNLTAQDNLSFFAGIYGVKNNDSMIRDAIRTVGLEGREKDKAGNYSKGMRQRLALARALLHNPELLILDEPTAGVDPSGQIEIRQIMLERVKQEGKTILLSSHNLDEVQRICNRIALIHRGEIRLSGDLDKLEKEMGGQGVVIETAEPVDPLLLSEIAGRADFSVHDQKANLLTLSTGKNVAVSDIVTLLAARGVRIEQVRRQQASLEDIYTAILKEAEQKTA